MAVFEIEEVNTRSVSCKGDDAGAHPHVYFEIAANKMDVTCPYCSKVFTMKPA